MERRPSPRISLLFSLFNLVHPAMLIPSRSGDSDYRPGKYCFLRQGKLICQPCTEPCLGNSTEIKSCTSTSNRHCHCHRGFYCEDPTNYTCWRPCAPCPPGSFSSEPSLNQSCLQHTVCSHRGMITISPGTSTSDSVCGNFTPGPRGPPSNPFTSASVPRNTTPVTTTVSDVSTPGAYTTTNPTTPERHLSTSGISTDRVFTQGNHSALTKLTVASPMPLLHTIATNRNPQDQMGKPISWQLALLLAILLIFGVVTLVYNCRHKGLSFGDYQKYVVARNILHKDGYTDNTPQQKNVYPLNSSECLNTQKGALVPSSGSCKGGVQHVTVDGLGRGENISNTVGSIFIYSPGTVVLGANAAERKEDNKEEAGECLLVNVPQQESHSNPWIPDNSDPMTVSSQEEEGSTKLSYPIPATSK
ncbi:uncharacterized protein LOC114801170 [Denticeps clupeoides]|uniref:uncharacterized protein LOC114801170 n=1 Tax=Denticeps clupeoides TaxID=299321 RepID=UPI0010A324D6|nr:uncharacterized protein LOC114801170 [Denticeps clupeoides]